MGFLFVAEDLTVTPLLMWAIVLLLLGLGLIVMEAFIPSAGILGGAAALAVLAAVGMAFYSSPVHGVLMLTAAIVATPVCVALVLRWWPHTPIGRRILLQVPTSEDVARDNPRLRELQALLGQVGRAKNVMLPSGPVEIGGRIIDAVSEGMPIDAGQAVEVVEPVNTGSSGAGTRWIKCQCHAPGEPRQLSR